MESKTHHRAPAGRPDEYSIRQWCEDRLLDAHPGKHRIRSTLRLLRSEENNGAILDFRHPSVDLSIPFRLNRGLIGFFGQRHGVFVLQIPKQVIHFIRREAADVLFLIRSTVMEALIKQVSHGKRWRYYWLPDLRIGGAPASHAQPSFSRAV